MLLTSLTDWIVWALIAGPLCVIAYATLRCALYLAERRKVERFKHFNDLMRKLADPEAAMADKMTAAYELRHYREYAEVIRKIFDDGHMRKDDPDLLVSTLRETVRVVGRG
ncbi:MAG: hypothetical protein ACK41P_09790 [Asticcacaulis sp.]